MNKLSQVKNSLILIGDFLEGKATLQDTVKALLPVVASAKLNVKVKYANTFLKMAGLPENLKVDIKITAVKSDGQQWLGILLKAE